MVKLPTLIFSLSILNDIFLQSSPNILPTYYTYIYLCNFRSEPDCLEKNPNLMFKKRIRHKKVLGSGSETLNNNVTREGNPSDQAI